MSLSENIENYSQAKDLKFSWEGPLHNTELEINIPDFTNNKYELWADWGPMYTVHLTAQSPLKVSYRDMNTNKTDSYTLDQKSFKLNSPMLAATREKYPFFFEILDERKDFKYQLYLNRNSQIARVEIYRNNDNVILYKKNLNLF